MKNPTKQRRPGVFPELKGLNNMFTDENGVMRHAMRERDLDALYKQLDEFIADCTVAEYERNKDHFIAIKTLIHQRELFTK